MKRVMGSQMDDKASSMKRHSDRSPKAPSSRAVPKPPAPVKKETLYPVDEFEGIPPSSSVTPIEERNVEYFHRRYMKTPRDRPIKPKMRMGSPYKSKDKKVRDKKVVLDSKIEPPREVTSSPRLFSDDWWCVLKGDCIAPNRIVKIVFADSINSCADLQKLNKESYLSKRERDLACRLKCRELSSMCHDGVATGSFDFGLNITGLWANFTNHIMNQSSAVDEKVIEERVVEAWYEVVATAWPFLATLIPILLNQYKYYDWKVATALMGLLLFVNLFLNLSTVKNLYVSVTVLVCLMTPSGSSLLTDAVVSYIVLLLMMCSLFVTVLWVQFVVCLCCIVLFMWYLHTAFIQKRAGGQNGILILLCQIMFAIEQMGYIRARMMLHSLSSVVFEMVLSAIYPGGESAYYYKNVARLSKLAVNEIGDLSPQHEVLYFSFMFVAQIIMFLTFRAMLGMYIVSSLRYKFDILNIWRGMYIYSGDLFGGGWYILCCLFNSEKSVARRWAYALVNVSLLVMEMQHARDFMVVRLITWLLMYVIFRSNYAHMPKYLAMDVDFGKQAFPQDGAPVWANLIELCDFGKFVKKLRVQEGVNYYTGLGLLRSCGPRRDAHLYTVKHIIGAGGKIIIDDVTIHSPKVVKTPTAGFDPVTIIETPFSKGADIDLLTKSDLSFVTQLFFMAKNEEDNIMICAVNEFSFKDDELSAVVNLKKGDSGGPVFALLKNGNWRYCGCVSRGSHDEGAGNFISFIVRGMPTGKLDSDSDPDHSDDDNANHRFNETRKNRLIRSSALAELAKFKKKFNVIIADAGAEEGKEVQWQDEEDDKEDECDDQERAKRKKAKKVKKKFRNQMKILREAVEPVAKIALGENAEAFMTNFDKGRFLDIKPHEYVEKILDNGAMMIDDNIQLDGDESVESN